MKMFFNDDIKERKEANINQYVITGFWWYWSRTDFYAKHWWNVWGSCCPKKWF